MTHNCYLLHVHHANHFPNKIALKMNTIKESLFWVNFTVL